MVGAHWKSFQHATEEFFMGDEEFKEGGADQEGKCSSIAI